MTDAEVLQAIRGQMAPRFGLEGVPLRQAQAELIGGPADGVAIALAPHVLRYGDRLPVRGEHDDSTGKEKVYYLRRDRQLCADAAPIVEYVYEGLPS